jgi:hypothetical protein
MSDPHSYERIEGFLLGTLEAAEREAFEKLLLKDASLRSRLEQHRLADVMIKKNSLLAIKDWVAEENNRAERKEKVKKAMLIVGATALVAGLALWGYFMHSEPKRINEAPVPIPSKSETKNSPILTNDRKNIEGNQEKAAVKSVIEPAKSLPTPKLNIEKKEEAPTLPSSSNHVPSGNPLPEMPSSSPRMETASEKVPEVKAAPCEKVELSAHVQITPSCQGNSTGAIHVSGFKGGSSPYQFKVLQEGGESVNSPLHLGSGKYSIALKDAAGCSKLLEGVQVKEQDCQTEFAFNPFIGEVWEIPVYASKGSLTLYDELGNVYFRSEIEADQHMTWSGYSVKGELKTGYFPFTIKYVDGYTKNGGVSIGK